MGGQELESELLTVLLSGAYTVDIQALDMLVLYHCSNPKSTKFYKKTLEHADENMPTQITERRFCFSFLVRFGCCPIPPLFWCS